MDRFQLKLKIWHVIPCFFLFIQINFAQENSFSRFVDSADVYTNQDSKKAKRFLDSIPKPVEEFIQGSLAQYYHIKSIVHNFDYENSQYQQCTILALKYAKIEDKPCIAGQSCSNLASEFFHIARDSVAHKYLDLAHNYFKRCEEFPHGIVDVETMRAYSKLTNGLYKDAIGLLKPRFNYFKSIKDDKYYYAFACYMLANSYINLDSLAIGHYYHKELLKLRNNDNLLNYNYLSFDVNANFLFARAHYRKKNIDSTLFYLDRCKDYKDFMGANITREYFKTYSDVYEHQGNMKLAKVYIDSLIKFEDAQHIKSVDANIEISDALLKAENEILKKSEAQSKYKIVILLFLIVAILLGISYFLYNKRQKRKLKSFQDKTNNLEYIKSNNKELSLKVKYLEDYIKNLRSDIKAIAQIRSLDKQKDEIKALYKDVHVNSSTILEKSDSHLDLINDLNINFFQKLEKLHPDLNKSEIIICYYISMGFTNKEISAFLNTSVRAVESKRYRISKKLKINSRSINLLEYLNQLLEENSILSKA